MDNGNSGFTIWPATAPAGLNSTANGGTEYFLSSNAADEAHGNGVAVGPRSSHQLLVWSLAKTSSLATTARSITLAHKVLTVVLYVVPARSEQQVGHTHPTDCLDSHVCAPLR